MSACWKWNTEKQTSYVPQDARKVPVEQSVCFGWCSQALPMPAERFCSVPCCVAWARVAAGPTAHLQHTLGCGAAAPLGHAGGSDHTARCFPSAPESWFRADSLADRRNPKWRARSVGCGVGCGCSAPCPTHSCSEARGK